MRGHPQLHQGLFAAGKRTFEVTSDEGLERLLFLPLRMLGRQRFNAVEGKGELEIERLLGLQRAIVIKRGDAFRLGHKVLTARRGYALHKIHNGAFGYTVSPRR
jgi:hypothetical protein